VKTSISKRSTDDQDLSAICCRFDCGSGEAVLETNNTIHLNEWNTIEITQTDSNGVLQLNEQVVRGRSKVSRLCRPS